MTETAIPSAFRDGPAKQAFSTSEIETLRRSFAEDGYLIFKNIVSPQKLSDLQAKIREEFERAKRTGTLFSGGGQLSGHLNCFPGEASRFAYEALKERG